MGGPSRHRSSPSLAPQPERRGARRGGRGVDRHRGLPARRGSGRTGAGVPRPVSRRVVVIGGGPAGLKAAHDAVKGGASVTLLESGPILGGLASSFDVQGTRIERYYHFICKGDDDLQETLAELGLSHLLHWRDSRMAYFVEGALYPFLTPVELLRFAPLSPADRVRAGIARKRAQRMRGEALAPRRAVEWLKEMFGERAYRVSWEPLMRFKSAEHAPEVRAAWIWARMVRLS